MPAQIPRAYELAASCLFTLIFIVLGLSSYDYAKALSNGNFNRVSAQNILLGMRSRQGINLDAEIVVQEQTLQFMVWPKQRLKTQTKLKNLLQQQVNRDPYGSTSLLPLVSLQAEINSSMDEKLWTLQRSIKLNQWQENLRPLLARYCLLYNGSIQQPLRQDCDHVIDKLPWQSKVAHLAKLLGVDQSTLEEALARVRRSK